MYTDRDGNNASLVVTGSHATLPTETTMVLYRAAQEALTNIRKHAGNSPVTVKLDYAGNAVSLTVLNELIPHESDLASVGAGYGLPGLRERVDAVDGTLTAGRRAGSGNWASGYRYGESGHRRRSSRGP
ncbi:sensor histidine kinase [Kibdelosporangium philippinense]|uniref:sensor histidine kinase n=1 Tax=Kibdelosporangium philippinense TaxID=211113 RepID=UPI00361B9B29